jgi:tRNA-specific 2-thiouridylase
MSMEDGFTLPGSGVPPRRDEEGRPLRAVGMISGGLDSTLAAKLIAGMGIDVIGVNFSTGFCLTDHHRAMARFAPDPAADTRRLRNEALRAGVDVRIPVEVIDIAEDYLREVVLEPRFGRGQGMNPCLDCRIYMLRHARRIMEERETHFVFTGEVLGQRPMSQHLQALKLVEREAGLEGLLLRPLSARHLEPTLPEQRGWVDREQLLDIHGRSRKVQMALADAHGIFDYPQPAGGCCFLPDLNFARRLQDLFDHTPDRTALTREDMLLLKVGRHFRLGSGIKVVVGRDAPENAFLEGFQAGRWVLQAPDHGSPLTLVEAGASEEDLLAAAALTARYCGGREEPRVRVQVTPPGPEEGEERIMEVAPADPATVQPLAV